MKHYYDPWGHKARIMYNRTILFGVLTIALGGGWWCAMLDVRFGRDALAALRLAWTAISDADAEAALKVMFWQSIIIGGLLTACLYLVAYRRARLPRGERHRRGTRVDYGDLDDE